MQRPAGAAAAVLRRTASTIHPTPPRCVVGTHEPPAAITVPYNALPPDSTLYSEYVQLHACSCEVETIWNFLQEIGPVTNFLTRPKIVDPPPAAAGLGPPASFLTKKFRCGSNHTDKRKPKETTPTSAGKRAGRSKIRVGPPGLGRYGRVLSRYCVPLRTPLRACVLGDK
jgi:hypothetical protein